MKCSGKVLSLLSFLLVLFVFQQGFSTVIVIKVETNTVMTLSGNSTNVVTQIVTNVITNKNWVIGTELQTNTVITISSSGATNTMLLIVTNQVTNEIADMVQPPIDNGRVWSEIGAGALGGMIPFAAYGIVYFCIPDQTTRNSIASYAVMAAGLFSLGASIGGVWWMGNLGDETGDLWEGPVMGGVKGFVLGVIPAVLSIFVVNNTDIVPQDSKAITALIAGSIFIVAGETTGAVLGMNAARQYKNRPTHKVSSLTIEPEFYAGKWGWKAETELVHWKF
jgi:hypothetical protein